MRIDGSSGYRCGKPCAICSGDQRRASKWKTAARKRVWMASVRGLRG
jgi:hypothetical protein